MTQKEFITRFKALCEKYNISHIHCDDEDRFIRSYLSFVNSQEGEVWSDYASTIGFNENGFYIAFNDTNCLVYEEDLCFTSDDDWDSLWDSIADAYDMPYCDEDPDDDTHDFKVGDKVYWTGQCVDDYPAEEQAEVQSRRFVVVAVHGEYMDSIIEITDCYTDAEVTADELVHCYQVEM